MARKCLNNQEEGLCVRKIQINKSSGAELKIFQNAMKAFFDLLEKEGPKEGLYFIEVKLFSSSLGDGVIILSLTPDCEAWVKQRFPNGIGIKRG